MIQTCSGGTHEFVAWPAKRGRWLSYSFGTTLTDFIHQAVPEVPAPAWTPAVEPGGEIRDGAWVADLAGDCLTGWPKGMRLIVRKEHPRPGAQLRSTDAEGLRLTAFATNTTGLPDLPRSGSSAGSRTPRSAGSRGPTAFRRRRQRDDSWRAFLRAHALGISHPPSPSRPQ